jgi:cytoskeleton protein RodZ
MGAGERFKAARTTLGKSLEEVSAELRISLRYIRGIEESDFNGFPARVFTVGFIKAYAVHLQVDPEPAIQEYVASIGDHPGHESLHPVAVSPQWVEKAKERGHRMFHYMIAALVVLLIGSALAWYTSRPSRPPMPPQATPAGNDAIVPAPPAAGGNPGDNATRSTSPAPPMPAPATGGTQPQPPVSFDNAAEALRAESPPYNLFLEANEQTWLMYGTDDAESLETMLYPGEKLSIHAKRKVHLKLGNAGGVVPTLNGRRLAPFGGRGQVRVVVLGR